MLEMVVLGLGDRGRCYLSIVRASGAVLGIACWATVSGVVGCPWSSNHARLVIPAGRQSFFLTNFARGSSCWLDYCIWHSPVYHIDASVMRLMLFNKPAAPNPARAPRFDVGRRWRRVGESER